MRLFRSVISLGPEKGFPVLRELGLREMGNSIDSASGSFQPAALCQPYKHGIEDASITSLLRGQQSVVFLGNPNQFVHSCTRHDSSMKAPCRNVNIIP